MKDTKIEWADHTFNPWEGCTRVSPGCAHCYAETRNARFGGGTAHNWGPGAPRRRTSVANWAQPLKWDKQSSRDKHELLATGAITDESGEIIATDYRRPRVFCASLADWLDAEVPVEWLAYLLDLIRRTPNLDWLLLTKRPQNWEQRILLAGCLRDSMPDGNAFGDWVRAWRDGTAPANVWIGTTVEDQARADERIPALLKIPARVRFLSCEPLLGPVDLSPVLDLKQGCRRHINSDIPSVKAMASLFGGLPNIDWIICGGESGPKARPMHPDWARSLRDQCAAAGVPFLFKQWGESLPRDQVPAQPLTDLHNGTLVEPAEWTMPGKGFQDCPMLRVGKHAAGRLLDGREHNEFPEVRS